MGMLPLGLTSGYDGSLRILLPEVIFKLKPLGH